MPESPIARKLGIKPGHRVLLKGAPNAFPIGLGTLPEGVTVDLSGRSGYDSVLLFARKVSELKKVAPSAIAAVREGGLLWICYPKVGTEEKSDLKRDVVWEAMTPTGWRPVSQIALDPTWSALRFRPEADVKPKSAAKPRSSSSKTASVRASAKKIAKRVTSRPGRA